MHDLTQESLAQKLGVTRQTIVSLENGKYDPSIALAFKVARLFGVKIKDVFIYDEDEGSLRRLAWGSESLLEVNGSYWNGHSIMGADTNRYRVYYMGNYSHAAYDIFYIETLNYGATWSTRVAVTNNSLTNAYINVAKKVVAAYSDYVWTEGAGNPLNGKYALFNPSAATTTTIAGTTTTTLSSSMNLGGVCSGIGDALGISDDAGCMLLSFILLFMVLVPLGMLTKNFWVILIVGFTFAGFLTAVQWLPVWIMVMLSLMVALMLGSRLAGLTSRGGSDEGD